MLRRIAAIALALVLTGCAAKVGGRANYRELTVANRWVNAQHELAERTEGLSYTVPYAMFTWKFLKKPMKVTLEDGSFFTAAGYFYADKREIGVLIYTVPRGVIEHEACHAILYMLGDPGFVVYCHSPERPWIND